MIGYKENFLNNNTYIELPKFSDNLNTVVVKDKKLREMIYLDYIHYSVVMNKITKQLICAASNIDQSQYVQTSRTEWESDDRISSEFQLNNEHYRKNAWDKGHMVRRATNSWGKSKRDAQKASDATMYYTNTSFQHKNFNRDEWLKLEEMFMDFDDDVNNKLTIFTGPIHLEYDRYYSRSWHESVRIPSGFFKIICFLNKNGQLETRAFIMYQDDEALKGRFGAQRGFKSKNYQVTTSEVEELTGIQFDSKLYSSNPLRFNKDAKEAPERIVIDNAADVISSDKPTSKPKILEEEKQSIKFLAALVNPKGEERSQEWISLFNETNEAINLKGWIIKDTKGRTIALEDTIVDSGESKKIYMKDYNNAIILNNTGNGFTLSDRDEQIVDSVNYTKNQVKELAEGKVLRFLN